MFQFRGKGLRRGSQVSSGVTSREREDEGFSYRSESRDPYGTEPPRVTCVTRLLNHAYETGRGEPSRRFRMTIGLPWRTRDERSHHG